MPRRQSCRESGWLRERLLDVDHRRRFMKWLEANHGQGEEHRHLTPGSPYAESMLERFINEEFGGVVPPPPNSRR